MRRTFALVLSFFAFSATAATRDIHKALPLAANGSVSVDTHNGSVTVVAWPQPSVDIAAHIEAERDDALRETDVKISDGGSSVSIVSQYPNHDFPSPASFSFNSSPTISYTIRVPTGARVKIDDHNAHTVVTGLRGDLRIHCHKGSIRVRDLGGAADIEMHNGSADVEFTSFTKPSRFTTHNGDFDVTLPAESRFTLNTDTHRRESVGSDFPVTVTHNRESLNGTVNGGGPELRFEAHNGNLRLRRK